MGGFPSLPSGYNSAVSSAGQAAGAGASIRNEKNRQNEEDKRAFAAQQVQQQHYADEEANAAFNKHLEILSHGGIALSHWVGSGTPGERGPGGKLGQPMQAGGNWVMSPEMEAIAAGHPDRVVRAPSGARYLMPVAPVSSVKLDKETAAKLKSKLGVDVDENTALAPAAITGFLAQMRLQEDNDAKKNGTFTTNTKDFTQPVRINATTGQVIPYDLNPTGLGESMTAAGGAGTPAAPDSPFAPYSGLTRGMNLPGGPTIANAQRGAQQPSAGGGVSLKPPAPKAKKALSKTTATNDKGDVTTTFNDPETGEQVNQQVIKGAGKKTKPAKGTGGATKARFDQISKDKKTQLDNALKTYTAATRTDPKTNVPPSDEDKADAKKNLIDAYRQAQLSYEDRISGLTGEDVEHNDWADKMGDDAPDEPAPAKSAKPGAKPADKKDPMGLRDPAGLR